MKTKPISKFTLMFRSAFVSSSLLLAGSASGAGNLTDSPTIANLIYDPATGNVKMDTSEATGNKIISFQLENYNTPPLFIPGNYISPVGGGFNSFFKQVTTKVIADSDLTNVGFTGIHDFGNVFPLGLDLFGLQAYLKTANYTGESGSGQFELDLSIAGVAAFTFQIVDIARSGAICDLSWTSRPYKTYDLLSSSDLATPLSSWDVYDPDTNGLYQAMLPSGSGINTFTAVPSADLRRFFAVAENSQSLFFEGFEGATPTTGFPSGWVATAIDFVDPVYPNPTAWEVGTPSNVGPASAASGLYCVGTNIAGVCGGS
jgi:hypothetical protein